MDRATAEEPVQLTVLTHTGMRATVDRAIAYYQYEHDVEFEIIEASEASDLLVQAEALLAEGVAPDLVIAEHFVGDQLSGMGLVDAYCLPGQCDVCFGENPPRWCNYATGVDVTPGRIDNFGIVNLCTQGTCPEECLQAPIEPWCLLIHAPEFDLTSPDFGYDVPRGVFAERLVDMDGAFPRGIPWWFFVNMIWVHQDRGYEPGQIISLDEFESLVMGDPTPDPMIFIDSPAVYEQTGIEAVSTVNFDKGDPTPQPNVDAVFLLQTDTFRTLDPELQSVLVPIQVEGYRPEVVVGGAFVIPSGAAEHPEVAMDFAYAAFWSQFQGEMGMETEYLPVQQAALNDVLELLPPATFEVLLTGAPRTPEGF